MIKTTAPGGSVRPPVNKDWTSILNSFRFVLIYNHATAHTGHFFCFTISIC